uniref:Uncharacterized protein n=1 Tax=Glossina austeni TaxID=7395 RepID=A0A1A9UUB2_GLOAU
MKKTDGSIKKFYAFLKKNWLLPGVAQKKIHSLDTPTLKLIRSLIKMTLKGLEMHSDSRNTLGRLESSKSTLHSSSNFNQRINKKRRLTCNQQQCFTEVLEHPLNTQVGK